MPMSSGFHRLQQYPTALSSHLQIYLGDVRAVIASWSWALGRDSNIRAVCAKISRVSFYDINKITGPEINSSEHGSTTPYATLQQDVGTWRTRCTPFKDTVFTDRPNFVLIIAYVKQKEACIFYYNKKVRGSVAEHLIFNTILQQKKPTVNWKKRGFESRTPPLQTMLL